MSAASAEQGVPEVNWLNGRDAKAAISRLTNTSEFENLTNRVREDGNKVLTVPANDHIARATHDGQTVELGSFPVRGSSVNDAYITIGRDLKTGKVTTAGLEYITKKPEPKVFDERRNSSSGGKIRTKVRAVDATSGMKEKTFNVDPTDTNTTIDDQINGSPTGDGISVQSHSGWCSVCKATVSGLCVYGCGTPGWFLCGLLGITGTVVAGMGCLAFVSSACSVIGSIGCDVIHASEKVCAHPKMDMCHR